MRINSLENIKMSELTRVFNLGFSDYVIKFSAEEAYLNKRWAGARVQQKYSAGGWWNGKLSGILMSGIDFWEGKKTAFNAATCVAPTARGNAFTQHAYDFLLPKFKEIGVENLRLEVIQSNEGAVKVYEKIGFTVERELWSFSGVPEFRQLIDNQRLIVENDNNFPFDKYPHFIDFQPSWEHLATAINLNWEAHECFTLTKNEVLLTYLILAKKDGRIKQFYTNPSKKGKDFEEYLLAKVSHKYPKLVVVNVDANDTDLINFYQKIGLSNTFRQFEMSKNI